MKKVLILLAAMLLLIVPAMAEGAASPETAGYDWGYLGTIAGATAAVLLVVQYTKGAIDKIKHIPTRLYVYILALLILLAAKLLTTGIGWADVPLVALNAMIVATAAMGSYELTWAKRE